MARPRTANVMLPRDVQKVVKPSGKAYYYYAPRRGSPGAGKRINVVSSAIRARPLLPQFPTYRCVSATKPVGGELGQVAGAAAWAAADKRGVTRLQPRTLQ